MRLFVARPVAVDAQAVAGPGVDVRVFAHDRVPTREELLDGAREADGLVTLLTDAVDGALLAACPRLRVVANMAVGLDNVDLRACADRGVQVTHTPDVLTEATADLTWALILAVARRVVPGDRMVREGRFEGWSPTMLLGMELAGRTLGVLGFGRIGKAVARRAPGFGMSVIFSNRSTVSAEGATQVGADELFERSDVLTIHSPLTRGTRHLANRERLLRMKRGALLINTARGPIVDEAALAEVLQAGHLGGAGLDVYEREPAVYPALLGRDDVVLLPHIGSATVDTRRRMAATAIADAVRVLRGERPLHPAPLPGGPRRP